MRLPSSSAIFILDELPCVMAIAYKSIGVFFFFSTAVKVPFAAAFRFLVAPARGHPAKTSHRQVVAL